MLRSGGCNLRCGAEFGDASAEVVGVSVSKHGGQRHLNLEFFLDPLDDRLGHICLGGAVLVPDVARHEYLLLLIQQTPPAGHIDAIKPIWVMFELLTPPAQCVGVICQPIPLIVSSKPLQRHWMAAPSKSSRQFRHQTFGRAHQPLGTTSFRLHIGFVVIRGRHRRQTREARLLLSGAPAKSQRNKSDR